MTSFVLGLTDYTRPTSVVLDHSPLPRYVPELVLERPSTFNIETDIETPGKCDRERPAARNPSIVANGPAELGFIPVTARGSARPALDGELE